MSRQSMNEYRSFLTKILYKVTILTSFTTKETGTYKLNTSAFLIYLCVFDHNFAVPASTERGRFDELVPRTFPIFNGNRSSDQIWGNGNLKGTCKI